MCFHACEMLHFLIKSNQCFHRRLKSGFERRKCDWAPCSSGRYCCITPSLFFF
uniref:Uncharacterized protein n=1 Tax=Rhizophora mucronata TaxID=61149 RepID=A0A2P2LPZ1_RHIMU